MLKQSLFGVALAAIMLAYSSQAREFRHAGAAATVEQRLLQNLKIPGTDYEIDFSKKQSGGVLPSPALIKAIKYWLSFNFNLRATYPDPYIELAPIEKIAALRFKGFLSEGPRDITVTHQQEPIPLEDMIASNERQVIAVYDDEMKTIYLPKNWTGSTPMELSILVHEMVHHLQGATKTKYECPQERERLAYTAQEKWLGLFGRNIEEDFGIDPLTLIVTTRCIY